MRVAVLVGSILTILVVAACYLWHLPLVVGRAALSVVGVLGKNDLYGLSVGSAICWGGSVLIKYIALDFLANDNEDNDNERRDQPQPEEQREQEHEVNDLPLPAPVLEQPPAAELAVPEGGGDAGTLNGAALVATRTPVPGVGASGTWVKSIVKLGAAVFKWTVVGAKVTLLAAVWLTIPPLLLGTLLESLVVIPIRTPLRETPMYPWIQVWALGLVFLKIWIRCVIVGAVGDPDGDFGRALDRVMEQGVVRLDTMLVLREVIWPVVLELGDYLITPFCVSRTLCLFLVEDYYTKTLIMRFAPLAYLVMRGLLSVLRGAASSVHSLYCEIRDEKYLLRTQLVNREETVH